jgi:hypothetical protein
VTLANLIRPNVEGWLTADFLFNRDHCEKCVGAIAGIVSNTSLLAPIDWQLVAEAIRRDTGQREQLAWANWTNTQILAMTAK